MNKEALEATKLAIAAYLSTVWRPFDPDNPETWPTTQYSRSGKPWVCRDSNGVLESWSFSSEFEENAQSVWRDYDVVSYCDPVYLYVKE